MAVFTAFPGSEGERVHIGPIFWKDMFI
jgi:hypothetical protein